MPLPNTYDDAAVEVETSSSSVINCFPDIIEEPHLITHEELNYLVRYLNLTRATTTTKKRKLRIT